MNTEIQSVATPIRRKVLVYNPQLENQKQVIESTARTYGDLQVELLQRGLVNNLSEFKVMEGRTRLTLEDANAVLPTNIPLPNKPGQVSNDLFISLTPRKNDNGAFDRKAIMVVLKAFRNKSKENDAIVKDFFGNYTQMKSEDLEKAYIKFERKHLTATATKEESKVEVNEEVSKVKETVASPVTTETNEPSFEQKLVDCLTTIMGMYENVAKRSTNLINGLLSEKTVNLDKDEIENLIEDFNIEY